MSAPEKSYDFYKDCSKDLYAQTEEILNEDGDIDQLKLLISKVNHVYAEMDRAALQETDSFKFADTLGYVQPQHELKSKFNARVSEWLESKGIPSKEIDSLVCPPRTLRQKGSSFKSSSVRSSVKSTRSSRSSKSSTTTSRSTKSSSRTSRSNVSRASSRANVETARLSLKHLEEQHRLENEQIAIKQKRMEEETASKQKRIEEETASKQKRIEEDTALKQKFEMLQASHELEKASLEHQVLDEELNRGGFISDGELQDAEDISKNVLFLVEPERSVAAKISSSKQNVNTTGTELTEEEPTTSGVQASGSVASSRLTKVAPAKKSSRSFGTHPAVDGGATVAKAQKQTNQSRKGGHAQNTGHVAHFAQSSSQPPGHVADSAQSRSKPHDHVVKFVQSRSKSPDHVEDSVQSRSQAPLNVSQVTPSSQANSDSSIVGALTYALQAGLNKPNLELFKFNGDSTTYTRFIATVEATIEKIEADNRIRLLYLIQHCEGKAKSLIQYCVLLDPNVGYAKAKQKLYDNFGKKPLIARAYIKDLVNGRFIKSDDSNALIRFAHDIEECYTTLGHMNYFADLNCFDNICKIAKRLPSGLQNRWLRRVASIERQNNEPTFSDLMDFVKEEAQVVSSCYASASSWKSSKTSVVSKVNTHTTQVSSGREQCPFCSESHILWDCPAFARKGLNARMQFMRQKRLCDNCAKRGHVSKFCFATSRCARSNCKLKHHTLLHRDPSTSSASKGSQNPKGGRKSVATSTDSNFEKPAVSGFNGAIFQSSDVYLNVIPVKVSCGNKSVFTYAFLDQGSTATLCDNRLLDQLDVTGEPVTFNITTINGDSTSQQGVKVSLTITSVMGPESLLLDDVLSIGRLPISPNPPLSRDDLIAWPHLKNLNFPPVKGDVTILIGYDVSEAFWVLEERRGGRKEPYAVRTMLGWSVVGPKYRERSGRENVGVNFINAASDQTLEKQIDCLWTADHDPSPNRLTSFSKEDRYALKLMTSSKTFVDGHYEVALPWKPGSPQFHDNRNQALSRLASLKRRFEKSPDLKDKYVRVVESYISNGHAELIDPKEATCSGWYLPHHPVLHPRKPNKVRVVFDCAARSGGTSLNDQLLRGPDFLNSLTEVLMRFRTEKVVVVADIEQMFHQVKVSPRDRKYLRFLWWPKGDLTMKPVTYHMAVHLFGATSSPSCVQFCLLESVHDQSVNEQVKGIISNNFYMDDCLFSVPTVSEAVLLAKQVSEALTSRGFNLTKWLSNKPEVLQALPEGKLANSVLSFSGSDEVCERVLGLEWDVCKDRFKFLVNLKSKPPTRRGMLSILSSVFDPLGFAAPVILVAKLLLQELVRRKYDWDEPMTESDFALWQNWLEDLTHLSQVSIPRCFNISDKSYGEFNHCQLHIFADASSRAYGIVSFLRFVTDDGHVFCNFVMGKARLAPIKTVSIPRLELMAATLASQVYLILKSNLEVKLTDTVFWTDSLSVLYMINNVSKRFPVFVANRLSKIEEASDPKQWRYVESQFNPADDASRGLSTRELSARWLQGPEFLWKSEEEWPAPPVTFPELPSEFSVLKSKVVAAQVNTLNCHELDRRFSRCSSWSRLTKAVAWILRLKSKLLKRGIEVGPLTVDELQAAETAIVASVQRDAYPQEMAFLSKNSGDANPKPGKSPLFPLKPMVFAGVLRVGGRLRRSSLDYDTKHPIILPATAHITRLIVEDYHIRMGHSGMAHTWTSIRQRFWIVKGASTVRKILGKCLFCSRRSASLGKQLMADLPEGRVLSNHPPFFHAGVDFFGPVYVRQGRSSVKRYGCVFTCLSMRAVHLEISYSLSTDGFINALRRFISRRGCPHTLYSDNGKNFIGAQQELKKALKELDQSKVDGELRSRGIRWKFNPPYASHMGGIWERVIRSIKRILQALLQQQVVTDDLLLTLFAEVELIVNSRPLTPVLMDSQHDEPLTPNHLLMLRGGSDDPPGVFQSSDQYCRKRWRQVQYLSEQFWKRWRREYLQTLQVRHKWQNVEQNLAVDDLVLLFNEHEPRGKWPLGRVVQVYPDDQDKVRQASVRTTNGTYRRPVTKLCKILPSTQ